MAMVILIAKVYLLFTIFVLVAYAIRHGIFASNRLLRTSRHSLQDVQASNAPHISVLIPMHNEQRVAEHILSALVYADYPPDCIEIIPIDDHSDDGTVAIIEHFARLDGRVRPLIRSNGSRGKAAALMEAIAIARTIVAGWVSAAKSSIMTGSLAAASRVTASAPPGGSSRHCPLWRPRRRVTALQRCPGSATDRGAQTGERQVQDIAPGDQHEVVPGEVVQQWPHRRTQAAAEQVALNGRAHPHQRVAHAGHLEVVASKLRSHPGCGAARSRAPHCGKATSPLQAMPRDHRGGAGVRRLRPLRRRALSTWRPPGVDIRMRNPCVLRRYFFFG